MRKSKMMKGLLFATALCLVGAGAATLKTHSAKAEGLDFEIAAASVRYRPDEVNGNGLKFAFVMSNADYETWSQKEGAQFGAVILPTDLLDGALTIETTDAHVETALEWSESDIRDGYMQADVYLYGMTAEEYNRAVTVVGFASATGETTQYTAAESTSIAEQALISLETEQDTDKIAALENYLNEYTVSFVDENGENVASPRKILYGSSWTMPATIDAPTGKELDHWEVRNADNTWSAYDATASKRVTGNVQLKAVFKTIVRNVTFKDMDGNTETIKATYGVGLEKEPDMGFNYTYGDALVLPTVGGTKVKSINADSFKTITTDTTVTWGFAYSNHMTYNRDNSTVSSTNTTKQNTLAHFALNKKVTSEGFIVKMTINTDGIATPCVGLNLYDTSGDTALTAAQIQGGGKSIQFEANNGHGYRVMPGTWNSATTGVDKQVIWRDVNSSASVKAWTLVDFDRTRECVFIYDGTNLHLYAEGAWAATFAYDIAGKFNSNEWTLGIGAWCVEPTAADKKLVISDIEVGDLAAAQAYIQETEALGQVSRTLADNTGLFANGHDGLAYREDANSSKYAFTKTATDATVYASGRIHHDAPDGKQARFQGWGIWDETGKHVEIITQNYGPAFIHAVTGWDKAFAYNMGLNQIVYSPIMKNYITPVDAKRDHEMTYDVVVENNIVSLWLDGQLTVRLDLHSFGGLTGSTYKVVLHTNNNDGHTVAHWDDIKYYTGEEAATKAADLITRGRALQAWKETWKIGTQTRGMALSDNATMSFPTNEYDWAGLEYLESNTVTAAKSYIFEATINQTNMDGWVIRGSNGQNRPFVSNAGAPKWTVMGGGWNTGFVGVNTTETKNYEMGAMVFGQQLAGTDMRWYTQTAVALGGAKQTVVIHEGVLYILVNDKPYMSMSLKHLDVSWTAESDTTYTISAGAWDPRTLTVGTHAKWTGIRVSNSATEAAEYVALFTA